MAHDVRFELCNHPILHSAGLTGVLAAAVLMRHACTAPVASLGPLNPYVAAAFEEWGLGGGGTSGGGKTGLTAAVARQPAAAPPSTASPAAGVQRQDTCCCKPHQTIVLSTVRGSDRAKSAVLSNAPL